MLLSLIGILAATVAILWAVSTINGFRLVAICSLVGGMVGIGFWIWLWRAYRPVVPQIVQGPKRLATLAITVGGCSAAILSAAALVLNRQVVTGAPRAVDATVLYAGPVVGPKVYGWDARFAFEGDSYYQMISAQQATVASSANQVRLGLQKGPLGYEYIVAVERRP